MSVLGGCLNFMYVHIILSLVGVSEWPPFGKELLTWLTGCSLCIMPIYNFSSFPFGFQGQDFGSDCSISRPFFNLFFLLRWWGGMVDISIFTCV